MGHSGGDGSHAAARNDTFSGVQAGGTQSAQGRIRCAYDPAVAAGLAPIGVFAFKRPLHLAKALESLAGNPEFLQSPLHIFCDGARRDSERADVERVREVARQCPHPTKVVVEQPQNLGLARSIVSGVSDLCARHGTAIVIEDDLTLSPLFLRYTNEALDRYRDADRVMQVSGHIFPKRIDSQGDAVMLPMTTTYGWATWKRAWDHFDLAMSGRAKLASDAALRRRFDLDGAYPYWEMLENQVKGQVDSWGIKWYLSVFMRDGLAVFPNQTLVAHEFDGTGTHLTVPQLRRQVFRTTPVTRWPEVSVDERAFADMKRFLRRDRSLLVRLVRLAAATLSRRGGAHSGVSASALA